MRPTARFAMLLAAIVVFAAAAGLVTHHSNAPQAGSEGGAPVVPGPGPAVADPFAFRADRLDAFARRAAAGNAHLLYTLSPGGAVASAARTARWRTLVESAARAAGVDPDTLEGLVFLESAGRPDAVTPAGLDGAVGLTQILAETGQHLLGMHVDVAASKRATRDIGRALRRGRARRAAALERKRAQARKRFGREDLAFVSYHMGMGNLEGVLRAFTGDTSTAPDGLVADRGLSYPLVYFGSTPASHPEAWHRLFTLGDDSANYLWKIFAAREIMRLWRTDRPALVRVAALQNGADSAENVLHPPGSAPRFATPAQLHTGYADHAVLPLPDKPAVTGLRADPRMGELARNVGQSPDLYRGLRPEALAAALYIAAEVRDLSGTAPLVLTSTVRDEAYQRMLAAHDPAATDSSGLHATGWSFDVARQYRSRRQALAFQFVLDRLQTLNVIAWMRGPDAIHVTAGPDARLLDPLLARVGLTAP